MKTRSDAKLKTLPDEQQAAIYARCLKGQSYDHIRAWLRQDGVETSNRALSEFQHWYALRSRFNRASEDTENMIELLKQQMPDLPQEKVAELGATYFNLQALKNDDPELFLAFQTAKHKAEMDGLKLDQKERTLQLAREKFRRETCELFLKWAADQRAREITSSPATHEEKLRALDQLMFPEDWR